MAKNNPKFVIVHHTAVSYSKNPDQYEATKRYHIAKGWGDIGYHYEISKAGKVYKGRDENVPGAHTIGRNYDSIGICLDGNFDIELPTKEQTESLKKLLKDVCSRYRISPQNVVPHRQFAGYKTCYGSKLADDWARKLLVDAGDFELAKKLDKEFLLAVERGGEIYYVRNGRKIRVPKNIRIEEFVLEYGLTVGINNTDLNSIPDA